MAGNSFPSLVENWKISSSSCHGIFTSCAVCSLTGFCLLSSPFAWVELRHLDEKNSAKITLLKTNIDPENWDSQKENSFPIIYFSGAMLVWGRVDDSRFHVYHVELIESLVCVLRWLNTQSGCLKQKHPGFIGENNQFLVAISPTTSSKSLPIDCTSN